MDSYSNWRTRDFLISGIIFFVYFCFVSCSPPFRIQIGESINLNWEEYYTFRGENRISLLSHPFLHGYGEYMIGIEHFIASLIMKGQNTSQDSTKLSTFFKKEILASKTAVSQTNRILNQTIRDRKRVSVLFYYHSQPRKVPLFLYWNPYAQMNYIIFFAQPLNTDKTFPQLERSLFLSAAVVDTTTKELTIYDDLIRIANESVNEWKISQVKLVDREERLIKYWSKSKDSYFRLYCSRQLNSDSALKLKPDDSSEQDVVKFQFKKQKYTTEFQRYFDEGKWEKALNILYKLNRLDPQDGKVHYDIGRVLLQLYKSEEAIIALRQASEYQYDLGKTFYELGLAYMQRRWYDMAIAAFQECVKRVESHSFYASLQITKIYWYLGFMDMAVELAQELLRQYPAESEAFYTLALIYDSLNNHELATKNLAQAIALNPKEPKYTAFQEFLLKKQS